MTEEEFNETVRSNFNSLVKAAESILGCEEAAKDAVQQTLIRVWKNIGTFDPKKATMRTLLHFSVRRQAMDHKVSRARRLAAMERFWGDIIPERPKKADPRLPRVLAALEKLPEKKKMLVKKFYFEGKAVGVIAEEMGLSFCATKARLQTIKGTLRRLFKKEAA
jgi:RNA polymerase sigma-70 factor (ECF subfamily)